MPLPAARPIPGPPCTIHQQLQADPMQILEIAETLQMASMRQSGTLSRHIGLVEMGGQESIWSWLCTAWLQVLPSPQQLDHRMSQVTITKGGGSFEVQQQGMQPTSEEEVSFFWLCTSIAAYRSNLTFASSGFICWGGTFNSQ